MFKSALALISLVVLTVAAISCGSDEPAGPRWRVVLEPAEALAVDDLEGVLDDIVEVAERRIIEFGGDVVSARTTEDAGVAIEFTGLLLDDAKTILEPTGLLQFCEPVVDEAGNVAIVRSGMVSYQARSCEPERDEAGGIVLRPRFDRDGNVLPAGEVEFVPWARQGSSGAADNPRDSDIVWQIASSFVDGKEIALDSTYLRPTTAVFITGSVIQQPTLFFEFFREGVDVLEQVTDRLQTRNYPLAPFLDGEPIRDSNSLVIAPQVQAVLTNGQGTITGLSEETAEELSMLLNSGAYPVPVRIVEVTLEGE